MSNKQKIHTLSKIIIVIVIFAAIKFYASSPKDVLAGGPCIQVFPISSITKYVQNATANLPEEADQYLYFKVKNNCAEKIFVIDPRYIGLNQGFDYLPIYGSITYNQQFETVFYWDSINHPEDPYAPLGTAILDILSEKIYCKPDWQPWTSLSGTCNTTSAGTTIPVSQLTGIPTNVGASYIKSFPINPGAKENLYIVLRLSGGPDYLGPSAGAYMLERLSWFRLSSYTNNNNLSSTEIESFAVPVDQIKDLTTTFLQLQGDQ